VDSALRKFLGTDSNTAGFNLDKTRPPAVSKTFKDSVVAGLPTEGAIYKLKEPWQRKLDSLAVVLRVHQRQSVYVVRVFDPGTQPLAVVSLYARSVLLISDAALALLNDEELRACVAHEIGHEYIWEEYRQAVKRDDHRRLRELELFCDGIAILTLLRAGLDPSPLLAATENIAKFNRISAVAEANIYQYPSQDERKRFAEALTKWAEHAGNP
jgi:predicted Zn-dependent protease